jgi:hypothetical protein
LYGRPDVTIVVKDSLHYSSVDQPIFNFLHLVRETFNSEVVLVRLLLVQGYEGKEECTCFVMIIVMGEEVQCVVVVMVPLTKGAKSSFLYIQSHLFILQVPILVHVREYSWVINRNECHLNEV